MIEESILNTKKTRMMHQMTKTIFQQRMVVTAGSPEDLDIEQEIINHWARKIIRLR